MAQVSSSKVSFETSNVGSCMCPKCPVQGASKCVKGKLGGIKKALEKNPLKREDIPGLYCSTGTATCRDLDPTKSCMCGGCPIFSKYNLTGGTPVGYYCRDGSSR
jgi:hypothetical protein